MNWKTIKDRYAAEREARQLMIVECTGGSDARVRYYVKEEGHWIMVGRCAAYIGKNGLGKEREGDAKTPEGELRPLRAFGIKPDPGSRLPYLRVVPGTLACDEEGPYYNKIVSGVAVGGEKMWELSPEYNYGIETDYNEAGIWPLGSAIFIHCKGAKVWTGGCVALDERLMKLIIKTADSGLIISIH